ncbi:MAG: hypothetical protein ABIR80_02490, partial [Opitutaceae bacterium]
MSGSGAVAEGDEPAAVSNFGGWWRQIVWAALGCVVWTTQAATTPTIFRSGPGQVEVAAIDATAAQAVVVAAEEAWARLAVPLRLPKGFSTPVFVRLVPAA